MEKSVRCPYCSWKYLSSGGSYVGLAVHIRNEHDSPSVQEAREEARSVVMAALSAPTASDTHAELAALRDEVRRLREAMSEALVIIDEQTPALTGWRAREMAERVRSALRGGDPSNP